MGEIWGEYLDRLCLFKNNELFSLAESIVRIIVDTKY